MITNLNVLFLAKYAPQNDVEVFPLNIEDIVYAEYHRRVYRFLKSEFPHLISTSDFSVVLDVAYMRKFDYVFTLYNRMPFNNSEIFISTVLEKHQIPYLGATPNIRALAEDKVLSKAFVKSLNIDTPKWVAYNKKSPLVIPEFSGPYFVKPRFGATSQHIDEKSICSDWNSAKKQISYLHSKGIDVLLEEQIIGRQITSPVLNNFGDTLCLPCIEEKTDTANNVITYKMKRKIEEGLVRTLLTDNKLSDQLTSCTKTIFEAAQPLDYSRCDYIVENSTGNIKFIEFNICCNLGTHAAIAMSALNIKMDYNTLLRNILYSSLIRQGLIQQTVIKDFERIYIPIH
ncbi:MAG: hypothetical protein LBC03_03695 [Nitrososphaerota archaeon]|jgi:D-alanine-D-alanine ligase|nr:hypothetical protein [Nitrososphaerota archaeon]